MPAGPLEKLKRKVVEVRANGLVYRGVLLEATETEITLKRETSFVTIPMERVTSVSDPKAHEHRSPNRFVDPSFYQADVVTPDEAKPKKS
jgi:hypothetical protein